MLKYRPIVSPRGRSPEIAGSWPGTGSAVSLPTVVSEVSRPLKMVYGVPDWAVVMPLICQPFRSLFESRAKRRTRGSSQM